MDLPVERLANIIPCGITTTGPDGLLASVNPAYCDQTGYADIELIGTRPAEFLRGPETDPATAEMIDRASEARRPFQADILNYRRDGSTYWVRVEAEPVFCPDDGRFVGYVTVETDVTAQLEAHRARASAESLYTRMFETAPDAIIVHDGARVLAGNAAAARMVGVPDVAGLEVDSAVPEDDAALVSERTRRVLEDGETVPLFSHRVCRADGGLVEVQTTATRVTYHGRPAVLAVVRDVTAQLEAERARAEASDLYARIFETAPDPIIVHDGARIVEANVAACELMGTDTLVGADLMEYSDPRDAEEVRGRIREVLVHGRTIPLFDVRVRTATGSRLRIQATTTPVTYQGKRAVLAIMRDVTDQKATQDRVHMLVQAFHSVSDAVFVHDLEGEINYANEAVRAVYGLDPKDLHGGHINALFPPGHDPSAMFQDQRRTRNDGWSAESVHVRADGEKFPVALTNDPVTDRNGDLVGRVMVARDVTDAKLAAAQAAREQHQYKTFVETITEAVFRFDLPAPIPPGTPTEEALASVFSAVLGECNDHYARMLGYGSAAEIRGRAVSDLFELDGSFHPAKRHMLEAFVENGFSLTDYVFTDPVLNRTYSANAIGLREPGGIVGLWGTRRDLTQLYKLTREITSASAEARNRLASVLHDGILQRMTAAQNFLDNAVLDLEGAECDSPLIADVQTFVGKAHSEIRGSIKDSRLLMKDLSPLEKHGGLAAALEDHAQYIERVHGLHARVHVETPLHERLAIDEAEELYWIAREACNNAVKHAGASSITIRLEEGDGCLTMTVDDDGVGIAQDLLKGTAPSDDGGYGLGSMRLRANLIGAELTVGTPPSEPGGTRVSCSYPTARLEPGPAGPSHPCPE